MHTEIATRHGVRLANELGIDPALTAEFDMNAVKAAMGVPDVEKLTYREVQERRELIKQRLDEKRRRVQRRTAMPELPQMQALAERIEEWLLGATFAGYVPLGFSGLKTAVPPPDELVGRTLTGVGRRAKYVLLEFDGEPERRIVFHLSQAGRVDFEQPPKKTKPKGSVVRWRFTDADSSDEKAVLLREWGTERKAGWWVLGPGDEGPLATLGPEATSDEFAEWLRTATDGRHVHTILRDQHTVAGVGRGYADDALHQGAALALTRRSSRWRPTNASASSPRSSPCSPTASNASARVRAGSRPTSSASTSRCTARPASRARCAATT